MLYVNQLDHSTSVVRNGSGCPWRASNSQKWRSSYILFIYSSSPSHATNGPQKLTLVIWLHWMLDCSEFPSVGVGFAIHQTPLRTHILLLVLWLILILDDHVPVNIDQMSRYPGQKRCPSPKTRSHNSDGLSGLSRSAEYL